MNISVQYLPHIVLLPKRILVAIRISKRRTHFHLRLSALRRSEMQITAKLRRSAAGYIHYCPGCDSSHHFVTESDGHPVWQFDGNLERPTFSPSMRIYDMAIEGRRPERTRCHYFLRDGQIQFLGDCAHALADQTVPLPDLPEYMQGDKYGDGRDA